ncbi:hypothetical protein [Nocardia abscessus]|nr:hypothetical protein [Nocardia abscessus]
MRIGLFLVSSAEPATHRREGDFFDFIVSYLLAYGLDDSNEMSLRKVIDG